MQNSSGNYPVHSISLRESYQSLQTGFEWDGIPKFSVVTGLNGVGKTHLLHAICDSINANYGAMLRPTHQVVIKCLKGWATHRLNTTFTCFDGHNSKSFLLPHTHQYKFAFENERLKVSAAVLQHLRGEEITTELKDTINKVFSGKSFDFDEIQLEIRNIVLERLGFPLQNLMDLDKLIAFACGNDFEKLKEFLKAADFKYAIARDNDSFVFVLHVNPSVRVLPSELSTGEKMLIRMMCWGYITRDSPVEVRRMPIILLDEPDAAIHPSQTKFFIDTIRNILVKKLGIQVIMTTHRPTTVSMIPTESIFVMRRDTENAASIESSSTTKACLLLTADVVYVDKPFRLVFCESAMDVKCYRLVHDLITKRNTGNGNAVEQILFTAASSNPKSDTASTCHQVKNIVKAFNQNGWIHNSVFGIIDNDNLPSSTTNNILSFEWYSVENIFANPVNLAFAFQADDEIKNKLCELKIYSEGRDLKTTTDKLIQYFLKQFNTIDLNRLAEKDKNALNVFNEQFAKGEPTNICFLSITDGEEIEIELPIVFQRLRGHTLLACWLAMLPIWEPLKNSNKSSGKNILLAFVIAIAELKKRAYLPKAFVNKFSLLYNA